MYQLLFMTNDNSNKTFAANVPNNKLDYITEYLSEFGGFVRYSTDIYDDKISAKEFEGYGKFHNETALKKWLYENVFHTSFGCLDEFVQWYDSLFDEMQRNEKVKDICTDILYEDYNTGKYTMDVWRKLNYKVWDLISEYNVQRFTRGTLQKFIRRAFVDYTLEAKL